MLDIGGGGEGVIGQLASRQVIAIDLSARELLGAPDGPLKIVMDATDLKFLDGSFKTATSFFTLMYMNAETQGRALRELYRVIVPGGRVLVWDLILPARFDPVKDIGIVPLTIHLPDRTIETGYGTFFPGTPHDVRVLQAAGRRRRIPRRDRASDGTHVLPGTAQARDRHRARLTSAATVPSVVARGSWLVARGRVAR